MLVHKVKKKNELPFELTKKDENTLAFTEKMDGVNEPNENGKISNLWDPDAEKQTLRQVANLAKPQGQKWHFTLINMCT
ncbi:hypothetical protein Hanom_Chr04g00375701 [Helianthus anomalus]